MTGVYLIHFDKPYVHARHYIGFADDIDARIERHKSGKGARLIQVIQDAGITWKVVRIWEGGDKSLEKKLKARRKAKRFCPVCNPKGFQGEANYSIEGVSDW